MRTSPGTLSQRELDRRVGMRVRAQRLRRGLGVRACAELCGRSEEWLRQVETGEQPLDKLSTIMLLARVLNVSDLSVILGEKLTELTCVLADGRPAHSAVPMVRRALSGPLLHRREERSPSRGLESIRTRIAAAWTAWHGSAYQYTALGAILPDLLRDAAHLHGLSSGPDRRETWVLLARVFQIAQRFLYCVGEDALAARAADRALLAAEEAEDPILLAVSAWTSSMTALAEGRLDEAEDVALSTAAFLKPLASEATEAASIWGALQLFAAISRAKQHRPADAWRLWDKAQDAARALGRSHHHDVTMFSQVNVGIYAVAIDIETGQAKSALDRARSVDLGAVPSSNRRAQHQIDMARGHWIKGDDQAALHALTNSLRDSEESILYSPTAHELVDSLLSRPARRKPDPRLLVLAERIHRL